MKTKEMKKRPNNAFTLPEVMVSMAVFSIIMVLVGIILRGGEEQAQLAGIKMNLQESVREGLYRMALEIRESSPSRVAVGSGGSTLTFQIPANISNSGVITWSAPITFQRGGNGTQLVRMGGGQTTILANDIQSATFSATGAPVQTIVFSVTAQRTMTNGRAVPAVPLSMTGEARLRNP